MKMNFNVDVTKSTFDQSAEFNKMRTDRENQRGTDTVDANLKASSVIGLNVKEIGNIKQAITTMCDNITRKINEMETEANSEIAYKGAEIQEALKNYITNVAAYCNNLTSNLRAFNDKLSDVEKAWNMATRHMSESISGNAGNFATGQQYTEKLQ